ncbi:hypothetical protein B7P43_G10245 [Cryptotermes secundus]|uniref:Uncharacterized protein n=1 Tax=Cryptotermes secundus TaxID=105785 RepID=A0A2J7Q0D1_9NEOP|nr:hypothetical protein B7P43_G10245 [Cryptotermes secundus]
MRRIAPSSRQCTHPHVSLKTTESVIIVPHPPYSQVVFDSIKENDFHSTCETWKK